MRTQSKDEARLTGKVVLDAMGSDHAPHAEIDGALAAARDLGVKVILVGQPEILEPELKRCGWRGDGHRQDGHWHASGSRSSSPGGADSNQIR